MGKSEFHAVESLIENILIHLIFLAAEPDAQAARRWIAEVTAWNGTIRRRISPSMRSRLNMPSLWQDAIDVAAAKLAEPDEAKAAAVAKVHDVPCPFAAADFPFAVPQIPAAAARIGIN